METTGKLIRVTPQELETILDRLEAERATSLAIVGPGFALPANPNNWPASVRGQNVLQLSVTWPGRMHRVVRLRKLKQLMLVNLEIGESGSRIIAEQLPQLISLDISGNGIGDAGAYELAEHLRQLTSLVIGSNNIGKAGACAIATHLNQLTLLDISRNNIGESGAHAIGEYLNQLTSLDISSNNLGKAGAQTIAEHLNQLTSLDISSNNIGDAGAQSIAEQLLQLRDLGLDDNHIGQAAIGIVGQRLQMLTRLSVVNNVEVRNVGALAELPFLQRLNVSRTFVSDLEPFADRIAEGWPVLWRSWGHEQGLFVAGCPLIRPAIDIAHQGPEAVRNYFRELAAQGEGFLYEAKVLILGEGRAGKTSLLRRLYCPELNLPEEDETTRGIDIHRHEFVGSPCQKFRLNIWDFGGQQIYYATHQFFLTKNSLYVLVDDTCKDDKTIHDKGFKYWFEVVETLGERSPLLIFQNEKGGRSKTIDQPGIQSRFNNVKEVHRGNLEHAGSVESLRKAIEYFVQQLPHIGESVPKKWVPIRQELEQLAAQKPFISQEEYFTVYRRHLPFDRTKALHLSRYLHDLGVFLHFQDDPVLCKTVILQNQWATEAVFRILDDETIKSQLGRFTTADCLRLWEDSSYADMHFELRGMMEKFELCYRLATPGTEQWLAPRLLSPSKPAELSNWAKPDDLVLRFQYSFLPRGLVSRLMVRQHRYVSRLEKCWAHGAFFERNGTEVLVEETANGNEIELRARGPESKELFSVLSHEIEALNDSFKGLKGRVEKLVPCLCATCRATTKPEMYTQSLLVERKSAGKKLTIECHKSGDDVPLLELLDGLKLEQLPTWAAKPSKPDSLRTIKIFLASSAELREDRDAFDLYVQRQNDHLVDEKGIRLQVDRWEFSVDAMSRTRMQNEYNQKVRDCDIFVGLFKTKAGKFTEEEFDVAWEMFKSIEKPQIFTFFRKFELTDDDLKAKKQDIESLHAFEHKLIELGHYPTKYKDANDLNLQFRSQLTRLGF